MKSMLDESVIEDMGQAISDAHFGTIPGDVALTLARAAARVVESSSSDLLAAVRRGVESGTIKGEEIESVSFAGIVGPDWEFSTWKPGTYIVIGPVSDGGSET